LTNPGKLDVKNKILCQLCGIGYEFFNQVCISDLTADIWSSTLAQMDVWPETYFR